MTSPITIIDYGMGNIGSLRNMLRRIGVETLVSGDLATVAEARKLLLPGVGAFDPAMSRLIDSGLDKVIRARANDAGVPTLGVCLGMQLLTDGSEEGNIPGLGLIPARAIRFPRGADLKVPHMGWNLVQKSSPSPLTAKLAEDSRFYFVHSYHVQARERRHSILTAQYGIGFDAAIQRGNTYGAQFHPEKSHRFGMEFLKAFAEMPC